MLGVLICFNDHQNFKISEKWRFQLQLDPSKIGPGFECFEQHPGLSGSIVQVSIQLDMNFGKLLLRPEMEGTWTGIVRGRLPSYLSIIHCIYNIYIYNYCIYIYNCKEYTEGVSLVCPPIHNNANKNNVISLHKITG